MKIYIEKSTGRFITGTTFNASIERFEFKRGDTAKVEIGFVDNQALVELNGAFVITFGIKEAGKYDGDFVVSSTTFVRDAGTGFYVGSPNFNTTELNALLNHGDSDDTNDVAFVDLLFEVSANDDDGIFSSATSTTRVYHDVIKGDEGVPTGGSPVYPDAANVQEKPAEGEFADGDKDKLDAIEAEADVTDLANVGGVIADADDKAAPVDADMLAVVDSEATNALKTSTWANIKSTLKTYFDSLYLKTDNSITEATYSSDSEGNKTFITSKNYYDDGAFSVVDIRGIFKFGTNKGSSLKIAEFAGKTAANQLSMSGRISDSGAFISTFAGDFAGQKFINDTNSSRFKMYNSGATSDGLRYKFDTDFAANAGDVVVMSPSGHTFTVDVTNTDATAWASGSVGGVFVREITSGTGTAPTASDTSLTVNGGASITTTFTHNTASNSSTMPVALMFPSSSGWYLWDGGTSNKGSFWLTYRK